EIDVRDRKAIPVLDDEAAVVVLLDRPRRREAAFCHTRLAIKRGMSEARRSKRSAAALSADGSSGASTIAKSCAGVLLSLMICQRNSFGLACGAVGFIRKTLASYTPEIGVDSRLSRVRRSVHSATAFATQLSITGPN